MLKPRFEYDKKDGVWRGYLPGMIIPICEHCKNKQCDFRSANIKGCDSFIQ